MVVKCFLFRRPKSSGSAPRLLCLGMRLFTSSNLGRPGDISVVTAYLDLFSFLDKIAVDVDASVDDGLASAVA